MNQTFNNITISGKIYFSDGTIFDGTKVTSLANIAAFERNSILETTSILQDDLIVNKKIVTAESISAPSVLSNAISFTNDLDPSGIPIVQSIGFTGQLRDKINQFQETFNDIIPEIIDPPNKRIKLSNLENGIDTQLLCRPDVLSISSELIGGNTTSLTINYDSLKLNSNEGDSSMLQKNDLIISDGMGSQLHGQSNMISLSNNVSSAQITSEEILIQDSSNLNNLTIDTNSIQMSSEDISTTYKINEINSSTDFKIDTNLNILRFQTGFSNKIFYLNQDDLVFPYMGHVVSESDSIGLLTWSMYMGSENNEGWFFWVSNIKGNNLYIATDVDWASHPNGINSPPIIIKKWSTVKITLINTPSYGRIWCVSQF